ncbi:DUF1553 domain-containing protein [Armatimonas sp.]|uniref:DUF1553 domain-containing protein n=1 Tax=Armatimonas sp. TaxID=1872638 RepID=UPI00286BEBE3|nr:DUF1553 domain-containing protein [Armatimonas sp.]
MQWGILSGAILLATAALGNQSPRSQSAGELAFESKVRPLLLAKCITCHGEHAQQGGVRLDKAFDAATAQRVLAAVRYDGKVKMPPSGKLGLPEQEALAAWIKDGAKWPVAPPAPKNGGAGGASHWSFQPVKRAAVPRVQNPVLRDEWVKNPIDTFVLARLEKKKLLPSPPASRRELIRRVTYDLIGLPPTPGEVAAFERDPDPKAYEKLVEKLLASPHYGEKWGRQWLDIVRYAETNSYERDNPKPNPFRYRDYVIKSFNADKPYNRFLTEQLAGDELPDATNETQIATGFYRLGVWDDEPVDAEQSRYDSIDDMVTTVGQAFLGLTLDCARCHDHKIDPIPTKDYYQFVAIFQNINYFKNGGTTDEKLLFESEAEKADYEKRVKEHAEQVAAKKARIAALQQEFLQKRDALLKPGDLADLAWKYYEGSFGALPDFDKLTPTASGTTTTLDLSVKQRDASFAQLWMGSLNAPTAGEYTLWLDSDDGSRVFVNGQKLIDYDGSHGEGKEKRAKITLPAGKVALRVEYFQSASSPLGLNVAWAGPGFGRRPLSPAKNTGALGIPVQLAAYKGQLDQNLAAEQAKLTKEVEELEKAEVAVSKILVVTEKGPKSADTFILKRGSRETPGDKVEPGFPQCIGGGIANPTPLPRSVGRRTALANWITDPKNPLPARVMVNRLWQGHFGRGIVRTPNDYGLQGAAPTHPELLDWLASEFVAKGWRMKAIHRLILLSSTYQMSSRSTPKSLKADPENELFWRFDMRRLTAEEVRDSVLAVCGNLNLAQFGPSVYPDIQKEVLAGQSIPGKDWYPDRMSPQDKNRRSIYIFAKRSLLYPMLESFDAAETDRTSPARFATVQPTQALAMLNSTLMNQQAQVLADRVKKDATDRPVPFIKRAFSLITQREPTQAELARCTRLLDNLRFKGATEQQAQTYLCLSLLNLSEFMYLD